MNQKVSVSTENDDLPVRLALGRIFKLLSRPEHPGDVRQYEAARSVVLNHLEPGVAEYRPNYASDWNKGAQGDMS
jgi:hypothetical protein